MKILNTIIACITREMCFSSPLQGLLQSLCVCCERRKQKKSQKQQEKDEDKGVMKKSQCEKRTL
jgi:hypothetical protein